MTAQAYCAARFIMIKRGVAMITGEIRSEFTEVGLDCTEMIERFMDSEDMFLKYYRKFFGAADNVVKELSEAVASDDHGAIENRAHALKGLSGNVGLNGVYNPAKKIVDDVRAGNFSSYMDDFEKLRTAYEKAKLIADKLN